jgi:hypothetical protein
VIREIIFLISYQKRNQALVQSAPVLKELLTFILLQEDDNQRKSLEVIYATDGPSTRLTGTL